MARQTYAPRGKMKATAEPDDHMSRPDPMSTHVGGDTLHGRTRCSAQSKQKGTRCGRTAIPGGTVCRYHGGAAPQVKLKALERLQAYQDKAIDRLFQLAEQTQFPSTALAAVKDVLDRTEGRATEKVEMNVSGELTMVPARLAAARKRLAER